MENLEGWVHGYLRFYQTWMDLSADTSCHATTVNPLYNGIRFCDLAQMGSGTDPNLLSKAERQLRELVIYYKICLCIQSETGKRFIETIFSVIGTCRKIGIKTLHSIKSCIESFRLNRPAPQLIPEWCGPIPVAC